MTTTLPAGAELQRTLADRSADDFDAGGAGDRADLFRYLSSPRREEYRAILRILVGPLLADRSATELVSALAGVGVELTEDEVYARCETLTRWGVLVRGVRDTRATTIRDFHKGRNRFHASKLGGRAFRLAEGVMASADGAREVARELLGATVENLDRILTLLETRDGPVDVDALAAAVTTVFTNQGMFNDSVSDFYAHLSQVLTRYDLAGEEYASFKSMLLDYIDLIDADVTRHAPAVSARLGRINAQLDVVLDALHGFTPTLTHDGSDPERLPGRHRRDWEDLAAWYDESTATSSGPDALRAAAGQALGQLLTNAKRMLATAGTGQSRRSDFLKLAAWFDTSDDTTCHALFAATFGAYPARHLTLGPDETMLRDTPATASWWESVPVDVPVSLRDRGDRAARGRTSPVPDVSAFEEHALVAATDELETRRAAAAELTAAGTLHGAQITPAARDLLLDQVTQLLAVHQDLATEVSLTDNDLELTITLTPTPGTDTTIGAVDGDLTIHELTVSAHPAASLTVTDLAATARSGSWGGPGTA